MAIQIAAPAMANTDNPNHNLGLRTTGQIHTAATITGTKIENQIACTETSALVGGSQIPTPSSKLHKLGIGTLASKLDAKTNPPIEAMVMINFRNAMFATARILVFGSTNLALFSYT